MRIDLPAKETWNQVSDQYRTGLPFQDPAVTVQIYPGYRAALLEVTLGLSRIFAHKRTVAFIGHSEPVFEAVVTPLSAEGYTVRDLTKADLDDPGSWLPPIEKELLFLMMADDDPVTGLLNRYPKLDEALKDKRIFRIILSHASHRFEAIARPKHFDVRILSLTPDRALLVSGERCRIMPALTSSLPWVSGEKLADQLSLYDKGDVETWRTAIETFERTLPTGFKPYFKPGEERLYDRTVFYNPQLDGSSVIHELSELLGVPLKGPGEPADLESTSPCRWENPRFAEWLIQRGDSEDVVRGTVMLDVRLIDNRLPDALKQVAEKIHRMQTGT